MSDTTLVGMPMADPALDILRGWPRRVGRTIPGARFAHDDTGRQHGPWSHPHTAQAYDLLADPYAHDHEQRIAAREFFRLSMAERWAW